jgi:hypothetical protein
MKDIKIIKKVENNQNVYSTEGFKKYINKEFKINISLDEDTVNYIIEKLTEKVSNKENIEDKSFDNEILNCKIYFVYKENNIIIVFPDKKMKYPWDKDCSKLFANQI